MVTFKEIFGIKVILVNRLTRFVKKAWCLPLFFSMPFLCAMSDQQKLIEVVHTLEYSKVNHNKLIINATIQPMRDARGFTLLHYAAAYGNWRLIPRLVHMGMAVNDTRNKMGYTPLHSALESFADHETKVNTIKELLAIGANPWITSHYDNKDALATAHIFFYEDDEIIALLIDAMHKTASAQRPKDFSCFAKLN